MKRRLRVPARPGPAGVVPAGGCGRQARAADGHRPRPGPPRLAQHRPGQHGRAGHGPRPGAGRSGGLLRGLRHRRPLQDRQRGHHLRRRLQGQGNLQHRRPRRGQRAGHLVRLGRHGGGRRHGGRRRPRRARPRPGGLGGHRRGQRAQQRLLGTRRLPQHRRRRQLRARGPDRDPQHPGPGRRSGRPGPLLRRRHGPPLGCQRRARRVPHHRRRQVLAAGAEGGRRGGGLRRGAGAGRSAGGVRRPLPGAAHALELRGHHRQGRHLALRRRRRHLDPARGRACPSAPAASAWPSPPASPTPFTPASRATRAAAAAAPGTTARPPVACSAATTGATPGAGSTT